MRDKIGNRPYELTKNGDSYTIKFYAMVENAKNPDKVLFCLTVSKQEFSKFAAKIK